MIKRIKHLKKFGIFQDYSQNIQKFNKFNLIYGYNGSGKTTLVALFELLKKKELPDRFLSTDFSIALNDQKQHIIKQDNLSESNLNLHIFNDNFIKENIDWDSSVKSILLIAEEKIGERKQLDSLKQKQKNDTENYADIELKIKKIKKELNKFMTETAKDIKEKLQAIDTSDSYFMNYNKTKLEKFMDGDIETIKEKSELLNEEQIKKHIEGAKPNKKDEIELELPLVNFEKFKAKEVEISNLLKKSIVSNTIGQLITHSDIQAWVEKGLEIHKKHKSNKCKFCNNILSNERVKQLEDHFSKEYESFKQNLKSVSESISDLSINLDDRLPNSEKLYPEYEESFKEKYKQLSSASKEINNLLTKWKNLIESKVENPFSTVLVVNNLKESEFKNLNFHIENIKKLVEEHNKKTQNFEKATKKRKKRLELHYTTEKVHSFNYYDKQENISTLEEQSKQLDTKINDRKEEIQKLEESLSNEGTGAGKVNLDLHKFLGRNNISLQFNKEKKGYDIIRDQEEGQHSQYLSEGEKRAIAFIYFIIKIKEKGNKIEDSIIVIDDPVSSLDSNNLFHACSFLKLNCDKAKQLFVFTHNFNYFKLVRDWLNKKNENRKNRKKGDKSLIASFFEVNVTLSNHIRSATLENIPNSLLKYHSEYHYIFEKLFQFKDLNTLDINEAFLTANLSRKLLESFFYFKYPKYRSDLSALLEEGQKGCERTTFEVKDKIYNFINKYSHSDKIETNEDTAENLMGESSNIIGDIFKWIEEVDKTHYKEMKEAINSVT